jgi:hypothetical protein
LQEENLINKAEISSKFAFAIPYILYSYSYRDSSFNNQMPLMAFLASSASLREDETRSPLQFERSLDVRLRALEYSANEIKLQSPRGLSVVSLSRCPLLLTRDLSAFGFSV